MTISSISQTKTNTTSNAKRITNTPCHCTTTWHSLSAARRNGSADRLVVPHHYRAPQHTRLPYFLLSPSGPLCTARRYTSNVTRLVLGTLIQFLAFNHSILKHAKINIIFIYSKLQHHSTYASFKYKHIFLSFIIHTYSHLKSMPTFNLNLRVMLISNIKQQPSNNLST